MGSKVSGGVFLCVGVMFAQRALAEPAGSEPAATQTAQSVRPTVSEDADDARKAEAEARRQQALIFYDAGEYLAARREFERANQLIPSFRLLYNLGVVSMALADPASAYDYFERYLAQGGEDVAPDTRAELEQRLRELARQVAAVLVVIDTPGAAVSVDDALVGAAPLAGPLHLNPGARQITARLDARSTSRTLSLVGGETVRVDLELEPAPPPRIVIRAPAHPQHHDHVLWAGWATTAVLTAGAVVAGFEALSAQHRYQDTFSTITSRGELDDLNARATRWSIAADTLSGTAVVVGAYSLYMTLRRAPPAPAAARATRKFSVQLLSNQARLGLSF